MERKVTVGGKPHAVLITQVARTSFTASGAYSGRMLNAGGTSVTAALAAWAAKAKTTEQRQA